MTFGVCLSFFNYMQVCFSLLFLSVRLATGKRTEDSSAEQNRGVKFIRKLRMLTSKTKQKARWRNRLPEPTPLGRMIEKNRWTSRAPKPDPLSSGLTTPRLGILDTERRMEERRSQHAW